MDKEGRLSIDYLMSISGNDKDFCREILMIFVDKTHAALPQIERLLNEEKHEELRRAAHGLRSSMSSVSALTASTRLGELEKAAAEQGNHEQLRSLFVSAREACQMAADDAEAWLRANPPI